MAEDGKVLKSAQSAVVMPTVAKTVAPTQLGGGPGLQGKGKPTIVQPVKK